MDKDINKTSWDCDCQDWHSYYHSSLDELRAAVVTAFEDDSPSRYKEDGDQVDEDWKSPHDAMKELYCKGYQEGYDYGIRSAIKNFEAHI